jgi:hypothetical protein
VRERAFWIACALTGALVLVACALPFARLGLHAGDVRVHRTLRMVTLGNAGAIAVVASGFALLAAAVAGLRFGARGPAIIVAFVAAVVSFAQAERSAAYTTAYGGIDCTAYQASRGVGCAGPVLGPALADLYARHEPVPRTVEEQAAEVSYTAKTGPGLVLLFASPILLIFWAAYRAARLRIRSPGLALAVVAVLGLFFTLLVLAHLTFANYYD